jgi:hypothetical protein
MTTANENSPGKPEGVITSASARVSVRLKASDWETLVNFVQGDISNMDIADPNRTDTEKILNVIRLALAKAPNEKAERPATKTP